MIRKFTKSEKTEVLSPEQHKVAQETLEKVGKTSASQLSDEERKKLDAALHSAE